MPGQPSRELDLDGALQGTPAPPLEFADGSFELIQSPSAFTRIDQGWAEWLLEARRLLDDGGLLVIGLGDPAAFERLTGEGWDESRVGMTALAPLNGSGSRIVFHSEWWLRAHWGRAFEVLAIEERDRRRQVSLRSRAEPISAAELERPEPGEDRELTAASANATYRRSQVDRMERSHRTELDEQREDMNRELMRRAYAEADLDWARRGPLATLVAAEYEATTSWRLTKPLRAAGKILRRGR
jgi:SAM-dependent methyltransferase